MAFTAREARFIVEYPKDLNATQAAIRSGYAARSATVTASRLLAKANVQAELERHSLAIAARAEVEAVDVIRESARIGFADIRDVVTWDGETVYLKPSDELTPAQAAAIREVKVTRTTVSDRHGTETVRKVLEVKMHSKDASLDRLARLFPEFNVKHEVSGEGGGPIRVLRLTLGIDD